jgi:hypothetical protein
MRSIRRARGVGSVLALALVCLSSSVGADPGRARPFKHDKGSITACTSFGQRDASDDSVEFTVANSCTMAIECTITWTVVCAPDTKRRSSKQEGAAFTLATTESRVTTASAARCGDDGWSIDDVSWQCAPSKD